MNRVYRFISYFVSREIKVIILFFSLLFVSLCIGDGKQASVDIFVSGYIVFFSIYWFLAKKTLHRLPAQVTWLWFGTIIYTLVRSVTSDSVGYSLYTLNRFLLGYIVFHFFYTIANRTTIRFFSKALVVFVLSATALSLCIALFPVYGRNLPLMNLVYPNYGHNYLAYLLIFIVPIVLQNVLDDHRWKEYALVFVVLVSLVLTFARGAWLLVALYTGLLALVHKQRRSKKKQIFFLCVSVVLLGLFISFFNFKRNDRILSSYADKTLEQFIAKETPIQNRLGYWRQAVGAIIERPLLGSGPGTFYLASKRLQKAPLNYSWFAHSFPLQTLVEFGLVGSCLIFLLFYSILSLIIKRLRNDTGGMRTYVGPLCWGAFLSLAYSVYEFNLDFLVIWLLLWAILGICSGGLKIGPGKQINKDITTAIAFWLLLTFYAVFVLGLLLQTFRKKTLAFYVTAFDTNYVLSYGENLQENNQKLSLPEMKTLFFFHKKEPDVIDVLVNTAGSDLTDNERLDLQIQLLQLYPKNEQFHKNYIDVLISRSEYSQAGAAIMGYSLQFLPSQYSNKIKEIGALQEAEVKAVANMTAELTNASIIHEQRVARIYYIAGLTEVATFPLRTKNLWELAKQLDSGLSYYYVELASLKENMLYDTPGAKQELADCKKNESAYQHCAHVEESGLPDVGSLKQSILTFP